MRGLLMVEPLYHMTVAGKKVQTRRSGGLEAVNGTDKRVYGPQLPPDAWYGTEGKAYSTDCDGGYTHLMMFVQRGPKPNTIIPGTEVFCRPRYKMGEVLYLKEPTRQPAPGHPYWYRYTMYPDGKENIYNWSNKLFMPASAARAFVRITGIKCERLLNISDEDCIAEGVNMPLPEGGTGLYMSPKDNIPNYTPKDSFISLFKFANKVKEVPNLWVWAYSIEYLKNYQP